MKHRMRSLVAVGLYCKRCWVQAQTPMGLGGLRCWVIVGMPTWEEDQAQQGKLLRTWIQLHISGARDWERKEGGDQSGC